VGGTIGKNLAFSKILRAAMSSVTKNIIAMVNMAVRW
jgi:hypothetical protein